MGVQAMLPILLLLVPTAKAQEDRVTFLWEEFSMTCPEDGDWYRNNEKVKVDKEIGQTYKQKYNSETRGLYYCEYTEGSAKKKYYFYVKGRVCEYCFELDSIWFAVAIVGDVIGTAGLMFIIYRVTSKKRPRGATQSPKAPARQGGRAPPVPSPDYEQLNPHTRTADTYSSVNRMG